MLPGGDTLDVLVVGPPTVLSLGVAAVLRQHPRFRVVEPAHDPRADTAEQVRSHAPAVLLVVWQGSATSSKVIHEARLATPDIKVLVVGGANQGLRPPRRPPERRPRRQGFHVASVHSIELLSATDAV